MSEKPRTSTPILFRLDQTKDRAALEKLFADGSVRHVVDDYREQLYELYQINNPSRVYAPGFKEEFESYFAKYLPEQLRQHGTWVYYPWNDTLVHLLPDEDFQRVRTARNRNLITEDEQRKFYGAHVGIGGLSVGNSVALALALMGGARRIRLADFDRLALSNLNRIRGDVSMLGLRKVEMTARQIYALDPYAQIEIFPDGVTDENVDDFFDGLDVVVDELDTIAMKLRIREEAKRRRLPVVMGADNGDNAVVDIERYDIDPDLAYFHGRLGKVTVEELRALDKFGIGKTITKHIGPENITVRMQESLLAMGKTIVSWPQLGGAALLNGLAVAYCVRKIVCDQPLENNRAILSIDELLVPDFHSADSAAERERAATVFKQMFGL